MWYTSARVRDVVITCVVCTDQNENSFLINYLQQLLLLSLLQSLSAEIHFRKQELLKPWVYLREISHQGCSSTYGLSLQSSSIGSSSKNGTRHEPCCSPWCSNIKTCLYRWVFQCYNGYFQVNCEFPSLPMLPPSGLKWILCVMCLYLWNQCPKI